METIEYVKKFIKENTNFDKNFNRSSILLNADVGKIFEDLLIQSHQDEIMKALNESKEVLENLAKFIFDKDVKSFRHKEVYDLQTRLKNQISCFEQKSLEMNDATDFELKRSVFVESLKFVKTNLQKREFKRYFDADYNFNAIIRFKKQDDFTFYYREEPKRYYSFVVNLISLDTKYGTLFLNVSNQSVYLKTKDDFLVLNMRHRLNLIYIFSMDELKNNYKPFKFLGYNDSSSIFELKKEEDESTISLTIFNDENEFLFKEVLLKKELTRTESHGFSLTTNHNKFSSLSSELKSLDFMDSSFEISDRLLSILEPYSLESINRVKAKSTIIIEENETMSIWDGLKNAIYLEYNF